MHHAALDRPRAHDGHLDHQVVEVARPHARQHGHLRARFDLEHAHRIGLAYHVVHRRIFARDIRHRDCSAAQPAHLIQCTANGGEHAQREHIHFQQPQRIEIVLVPLDDGALCHRCIFDRHQLRKFAARNHEAAHMLRKVARKSNQLVQQLHQQTHFPVFGIEAGFRQPLRQHLAAVPPRHGFGQPIHLLQVETQRLAYVAHRALWLVGDHGGGECRALPAVFRIEVLDHLLAPIVLEIHVDVRRLVALLGDETLEQHFHAGRIHFGDVQCIAHRRVGGRATPLAQDAAAAGEAHDVMHGEEIRLVLEFCDEGQFVFHQRANLVRHPMREALWETFLGQLAQIGNGRLTFRYQFFGILIAQLVEGEFAALGYDQRLCQQLRVDRFAQGRHARADGVRRSGTAQPLPRNTGTPRRIAVSVSCKARR